MSFIGIGNRIGNSSQSWPRYWTQQSECYEFWDLSKASGGSCVGLKRGDILTYTGSIGNAHYALPNTVAYKALDTDYAWFKTNGDVSDMTSARLVGYDLQATPVKYDDASPNLERWIMILNSMPTGSQLNKLFQGFQLPIEWHDDTNGYGHIKSNRMGQNLWTPESVTDADSDAYIARMVVQPNAATKAAINTFFVGIKADGVYTEIDTLALYFLHTQQASLLDIKSDTFNHTLVNTPTWAAKSGFTIVATSHIRTNFIPATNGVKHTLNDAGIIFGVNPLTAGGIEGCTSAATAVDAVCYGDSYKAYNQLNSDAYTEWVFEDGFNFFGRSATRQYFQSNASVNDFASAAKVVPTNEYWIGEFNDGTHTYRTDGNVYRYYGFSSLMDVTKKAALRSRIETLYTAIQTAF